MDIQETEKVTSDNLKKLRALVDELDNHNQQSNEYKFTLKEIETVIKEEKKIISKLSRSENKIQHYEHICSSILSILSSTKI